MAGGYQLGYGRANYQTIGAVTGSTDATTITTGAANTKGSYSALTSSTTYDATGLTLFFDTNATAPYSFDLAVGGAGSEQIIVPDCYVGNGSNNAVPSTKYIPVQIPSGTRVAMRAQSTGGSSTLKCLAVLEDSGFDGQPGIVLGTTYNFASSTTLGTNSVDPGGTINTKGSWSEITSSTTYDARYMMVDWHLGTTSSTVRWLVDIGVGGSGSEKVLFSNLIIGAFEPGKTFFVSIPSGTRLACRAQCTGNSSPARLIYPIVTLLG